MKDLTNINNKIAYLRTQLMINPYSSFYRGELAALLWVLNQLQDSRTFREWKKRFATECDHFYVTREQLDDIYISTICIDCGAIVEEKLVGEY